MRPANPKPPPSTPFQPGASPSPPLNPILAGLGLLAAAGQALWGLLNYRPPAELVPIEEGDEFRVTGSSPVTVTYSFRNQVVFSDFFDCFFGVPVPPPPTTTSDPVTGSFVGLGVRAGATSGSNTAICSPDGGVSRPPAVALSGIAPDGSTFGLGFVPGGSVSAGGRFAGTSTGSLVNLQVGLGGALTPWEGTELPGVQPEETRYRPPAPAVPVPAPAPAVQPSPAPSTLPQTPPGVTPLPVPGTAPGGLPGGNPSRPPVVRPGPTVTPGRGTSTGQAATQPITAGGVRPQLPPAQQPTNTGTTFLPGGRPLVPNGPTPTMQGIATELGKLEQKLEIMLNPEDVLSPLEQLNRLIDQLENIEFLIERLFPPEPYRFDPGAYQLAPVCDRDSEGNLIEPLTAEWAGGEGEFVELRQRLDALAELIQHHKTLKQPTCGGRGNGPASNVTVHFESD